MSDSDPISVESAFIEDFDASFSKIQKDITESEKLLYDVANLVRAEVEQLNEPDELMKRPFQRRINKLRDHQRDMGHIIGDDDFDIKNGQLKQKSQHTTKINLETLRKKYVILYDLFDKMVNDSFVRAYNTVIEEKKDNNFVTAAKNPDLAFVTNRRYFEKYFTPAGNAIYDEILNNITELMIWDKTSTNKLSEQTKQNIDIIDSIGSSSNSHKGKDLILSPAIYLMMTPDHFMAFINDNEQQKNIKQINENLPLLTTKIAQLNEDVLGLIRVSAILNTYTVHDSKVVVEIKETNTSSGSNNGRQSLLFTPNPKADLYFDKASYGYFDPTIQVEHGGTIGAIKYEARLDSIFEGESNLFMAYGGTGAGKTYGMVGPVPETAESVNDISDDHNQDAFVFAMFKALLEKNRSNPTSHIDEIKLQCYELAPAKFEGNHVIDPSKNDLLAALDRKGGRRRKHKRGGSKSSSSKKLMSHKLVYSGKENSSEALDKVIKYILKAMSADTRATASTEGNVDSSRSHAFIVFKIKLDTGKTVKLIFADLAGVERPKMNLFQLHPDITGYNFPAKEGILNPNDLKDRLLPNDVLESLKSAILSWSIIWSLRYLRKFLNLYNDNNRTNIDKLKKKNLIFGSFDTNGKYKSGYYTAATASSFNNYSPKMYTGLVSSTGKKTIHSVVDLKTKKTINLKEINSNHNNDKNDIRNVAGTFTSAAAKITRDSYKNFLTTDAEDFGKLLVKTLAEYTTDDNMKIVLMPFVNVNSHYGSIEEPSDHITHETLNFMYSLTLDKLEKPDDEYKAAGGAKKKKSSSKRKKSKRSKSKRKHVKKDKLLRRVRMKQHVNSARRRRKRAKQLEQQFFMYSSKTNLPYDMPIEQIYEAIYESILGKR